MTRMARQNVTFHARLRVCVLREVTFAEQIRRVRYAANAGTLTGMFKTYAQELPMTRSHGEPGPQPAIGFFVSAYHNSHAVSALAARKQSRAVQMALDVRTDGWPRPEG